LSLFFLALTLLDSTKGGRLKFIIFLKNPKGGILIQKAVKQSLKASRKFDI
jgi:hypothetical protein